MGVQGSAFRIVIANSRYHWDYKTLFADYRVINDGLWRMISD